MPKVKPSVVRLKKGKNVYEILVNPGTVEKFRKGEIGWSKVAFVDGVFKNSSKGDHYNEKDLKSEFGTSNVDECMQMIARQGDYRLNANERKEKMTQKKRQVVNFIHKYYVDAKTNNPIPNQRIEAVLGKIKYNINIDESVSQQVPKIMKQVRSHILFKKVGQMKIEVKIPLQYIGKCQNIVSQYLSGSSSSYTSTNCVMSGDICMGDYDVLTKQLSSNTKGNFEINTR